MVHIETKRLILNEVKATDAPFIYELLNTKSWLQFIGNKNVHSMEEAKLYIQENYFPQFKKTKIENLVVKLKDTNTPIGTCGLFKREELEHPDIGFAFLPEFIGNGYGYEAASALIEYAKNKLNEDIILGFTTPANIASIKLLEKLGLQQNGFFTFKNDSEKLLLFSTKQQKNMTELKDIKSREEVSILVNTFYNKIRKDELLGPIFNTMILDWETHLDLLVDFWETQLFMVKKYKGNPLDAHVKVDTFFNHSINEKHFGIWLQYWFETIDDLFKGEKAQLAKNRARNMSTFMNIEIFNSRKKS